MKGNLLISRVARSLAQRSEELNVVRSLNARPLVAYLPIINDQEKHFHSAFEFAAIGMALVSVEGRWLWVNRALCNLVGYSAEELSVLTFQHLTHPHDLESDLEAVRRLLNGEIET